MAEILKSDLIAGAYSRARISGLTLQPSAEENELALDLLESMMAEWFERGYCIGYKFPTGDDPADLADPSGVPLTHKYAVQTNLAGRIMDDFGKEIPPNLQKNMSTSFSALASSIAVQKQTDYPNNMPRGAYSELRWSPWRRYFRKPIEAPISCDTNYMNVGEIDTYFENYQAYLNDGEDVSTFTIENDDGITILSSGLNTNGNILTYTVEAVGTGEELNPYIRVKITATTTDSRVDVRYADFQLRDESVGN